MARGRIVAFLVLVVALLGGRSAEAAPPTDFDRQVIAELQAIDPGAVPIMEEADRRRDAKDYEVAAAKYEEVLGRVPTFFHATRRWCGVEVILERREHGLQLCREAVLDGFWSMPSLKPLAGGAISGLDVGQDSHLVPNGRFEIVNTRGSWCSFYPGIYD